jgi:hypothetical protein
LTQKAYRFWIPTTGKIKISRDVIFNEELVPTENPIPRRESRDILNLLTNQTNFPVSTPTTDRESLNPSSPSPVDTPDADLHNQDAIQSDESEHSDEADPDELEVPEPESPNQPEEETQNPSQSAERVRHSPYPLRVREPKRQWEESSLQSILQQHDNEQDEPTSFSNAMKSSNAHLWKIAAEDEYDSLLKNKTWTLVQLPPGRSFIKSKWIFKIKPTVRGENPRFKARLVAKGFSQRWGIDYTETYAPVAKHDTLRIILSLVASHNLDMKQVNIKTAFLYGELAKEIYLQQPEGLIVPGQENLVCRLHKCLYGLKQASRVWNRHFDHFLKNFGLTPSEADPCLYFRRTQDELTIVTIWVDDGLICSSNGDTVTGIINYLSKHFDMRSSPANIFVGMSISRDRVNRTLYVSQPEYTQKILRRFHMDHCHPKSLPADPGQRLCKNQDNSTENVRVPFKEAIGSLMYLMLSTRPDIAFSLNQVSQFSENPKKEHWAAVKRILAYLQGTPNHGLRFGTGDTLIGYTDADYAGNFQTRQSTSGFIFLLNGGPVAWSSRRQPCVALSTTEAEFIAACEATKEGIWIRRLLLELFPEWNKPIPIKCDNQSAIELIKNPRFHQRTKHVDIRFHFIREHQEAKEIEVAYISTNNQLADPFTKPLPNPRFSNLRSLIGIVVTPSQ